MGILIVIEGLALLVLGVLGLQSRLVRSGSTSAELVNKITKYQGWIGIGGVIWGVIDFIYTLRWVPLLGKGLVVLWLSMFLGTIVNILLGVLFGRGRIEQGLLDKAKPETNERVERAVQRIAGYQVPLGYASLIGGAWIILYYVILSSSVFMKAVVG